MFTTSFLFVPHSSTLLLRCCVWFNKVKFYVTLERSRLFRVLTKLSTVVDRAELNGDFSWSEYGDCYMLKLFRDYVFHQVNTLRWITVAERSQSLAKKVNLAGERNSGYCSLSKAPKCTSYLKGPDCAGLGRGLSLYWKSGYNIEEGGRHVAGSNPGCEKKCFVPYCTSKNEALIWNLRTWVLPMSDCFSWVGVRRSSLGFHQPVGGSTGPGFRLLRFYWR